MMRTIIGWMAAGVVIAVLSACGGGYTLQGKVVRGSDGGIELTEASDSRLGGEGIGNVTVAVYRNPGRLSQELVASETTSPDGRFKIELPGFGVGWMDETWLIETTRSEYGNVQREMRLPANPGRRPVLITLSPGESRPLTHERDALMDAFERYR